MTTQFYPEPTVGALVFNDKDQLFLMRSHKWHDKYTVPGGHIELGETMEQALKREVKEETNMDIYDIEFITFQEFIFDSEFWRKRHFIFFDFACKTMTHDKDICLNHEAQDHIWVSLKGMTDLDLDKYTKHSVEKYIELHGLEI